MIDEKVYGWEVNERAQKCLEVADEVFRIGDVDADEIEGYNSCY